MLKIKVENIDAKKERIQSSNKNWIDLNSSFDLGNKLNEIKEDAISKRERHYEVKPFGDDFVITDYSIEYNKNIDFSHHIDIKENDEIKKLKQMNDALIELSKEKLEILDFYINKKDVGLNIKNYDTVINEAIGGYEQIDKNIEQFVSELLKTKSFNPILLVEYVDCNKMIKDFLIQKNREGKISSHDLLEIINKKELELDMTSKFGLELYNDKIYTKKSNNLNN